ncbi:hypothetical protein [Dyella tabacisoli]|uniref:Lipoprotein n=2 Tax=Dyella tabacisoli TaxID=2282381 RepID=A0A369UIN4_9GAMM|nr:hypothetical protein [Dyella tabacisoli]RDD80367.1 hypothetical protein DVJ77_17970 [Dyella tabacisoli]
MSRCTVLASLVAALVLAGCSQQGDSATDNAQAPAQAQADAAAKKLDTYRQLVRINNDEMAVSMGHDILDRFANSDAAKEVQQSLPAIEKRYKENSEKNRLQGMWLYQVSPMQGGTQSTATAYNTSPSNHRVRLVLRRHTEWGQNAFLYSDERGFVCKANCTLAATVDGKPTGIKAFAPSTGEPALMIRDDKAFIAMLEKAKKITLDVTLQDGEKKLQLVYEVGGFDAAKWAPVGKGGAAKAKKK